MVNMSNTLQTKHKIASFYQLKALIAPHYVRFTGDYGSLYIFAKYI